jgi:hypothetical protein
MSIWGTELFEYSKWEIVGVFKLLLRQACACLQISHGRIRSKLCDSHSRKHGPGRSGDWYLTGLTVPSPTALVGLQFGSIIASDQAIPSTVISQHLGVHFEKYPTERQRIDCHRHVANPIIAVVDRLW